VRDQDIGQPTGSQCLCEMDAEPIITEVHIPDAYKCSSAGQCLLQGGS
jgi:hypothetical protein